MSPSISRLRFGTLAVVIILILGTIVPAAGANYVKSVQAPESIDTGIGAPVSWQSPWESEGQQSIGDDAVVSVLRFQFQDHVTFVAQGDIPNFATLLSAIQDEVQTDPGQQVTVDSSAADPVSYWLDLLTVEGDAYGSFALGRNGSDVDTLTLFVGPVADFGNGFTSVQDSITIGDEPVFDGVGGEGLQALLDDNLPALDETSPVAEEDTPEATTPEPTEEPGGDDDGNNRYADVGMVGPRSYVSPQFGVDIEWTRDWDLDPTFGDPVLSDRKTRVDQVNLLWNEEMDAWMIIFVAEAPGVSMQEMIDYFGSLEVTEDMYGESATVEMADASPGLGAFVTLIEEGMFDPTLIYSEFRVSADGSALIEVRLVSINPRVTEDAIVAAQDGITVEGEPVLVYYPPEDVAALHEPGSEDDGVLNRQPGSTVARLTTGMCLNTPRRTYAGRIAR